ncbi:hypothetical protein Tco_0703639, partial [Tanacetum coccineum]
VNKARVIMSSATSAVTYTSVYTDSEPGRAFWGADDEEISEGGIPRVIVLGYDGLPMQPVAPPSPDYIPGLEDPQTPPVPQDEDEREPMMVRHEMVWSTNPKDGGDDDDGDSSRDDANGEDEDDEDEEEEEEEHLAPADSAIVVPVDESLITIRPQTSISLPPEAEGSAMLGRHAPPSLLSSPPPVPSPLLPSSRCPTQIQTLRIASTQALIDAVTVALPSPPLPPTNHPLYTYQTTTCLTIRVPLLIPTRGRGIDYGFVSKVDAEERRQGIRDVGYGIRDTWVDPKGSFLKIAKKKKNLVTMERTITKNRAVDLYEHDTQDLYALLEDAQDRDSMDGRGGGLCFLRGLGLLDRIESGDSLGASDPSRSC